MSKRYAPSGLFRLAAVGVVVATAGCAEPQQEALKLSLQDLTAEIESVNLDEAEADLSAGRYEIARQKFVRLDAADPGNPRIRLGLAEALLGSGHVEQALERFRDVAADPAYRGRALQGQGLALLALGETDAAGDLLEQSLEADSEQWRAWNAAARGPSP